MLIKKIFYLLFIALFALPPMVGAHTGADVEDGTQSSGFMMMERIEDQALGDELHEEMEELMIKMMSGEELSQEEIDRIAAFMDEYPGPHAMMTNRLDGMGYGADMQNYYGPAGMMGSWSGSILGGWITRLLLWTLMALGIVGLWKWIQKS